MKEQIHGLMEPITKEVHRAVGKTICEEIKGNDYD